MVEIFPYAERSRGISVEQFFVRGAGFFTTYINPIGMDGAGWKYLIMYIAMICAEILTIYFFYPETQGRTLEELAFCKFYIQTHIRVLVLIRGLQCLRTRASSRKRRWLLRRRFIMKLVMTKLAKRGSTIWKLNTRRRSCDRRSKIS